MHVLLRLSLALVTLLVVSGCSMLPLFTSGADDAREPEADERFPDVLAVELTSVGERVFDVVVTISSPYDTPRQYADGWRVLDESGNVLGTHTLLHDHAGEQPFTRTMRGLEIPASVERVTVEGRDQANGFGGDTITVDVPGSGGSSGATGIHDGT